MSKRFDKIFESAAKLLGSFVLGPLVIVVPLLALAIVTVFWADFMLFFSSRLHYSDFVAFLLAGLLIALVPFILLLFVLVLRRG